MPGFLEGAVMRPPDFLLATIKPKSLFNQQFGLEIVGATGFEPATAWSQTRSATGLRYTPNAFLLEMRVQIYGLVLEQANFEEVFYWVFGNKDEIGSLHATPFGAAWTSSQKK